LQFSATAAIQTASMMLSILRRKVALMSVVKRKIAPINKHHCAAGSAAEKEAVV